MAQDQIEEIKRKTDIVEIISECVDLKRSGRNFKALCPFHSERTPSFMVSSELQIFKCFGCGLGGDALTFLQEYEKIDFPQALKILADRAGVKLKPLRAAAFQEKEELLRANYLASEFYHYILTAHQKGKRALDYLQQRGVTREASEVFRLGFAPDLEDSLFRFLTQKKDYKPEVLEKAGLVITRQDRSFDRFRNRVMFPLHDHLGNVTGFAGRVIEDKGEAAKYINTPDTLVYKKGNLLYGLQMTKQDIKEENWACVVEGELDTISSWQVGIRNVVAIKGSAFTEEQLTLLSRFCSEIRLATDADLAGDQAARRIIEQASTSGISVKVVRLGKFKDPDQAAQRDPGFFQKAVKNAQEVHDYLMDSTFEKFDASTTEGKAKISRELVPVLSSIEDEIIKAHCIRKMADKLGVSEEAVYAQMEKTTPSARPRIEEKTELSKKAAKPRREILEEYYLSMAFQLMPEILKDGDSKSFIKSPACAKVLAEWEDWSKKNKKEFDPSEFADVLPGELRDLFARMILLELSDNFEDPRALQHEVERTKKELEILNIKEEMAKISEQIEQLEEEGKSKGLGKLEKEFARAGQKLTILEAA